MGVWLRNWRRIGTGDPSPGSQRPQVTGHQRWPLVTSHAAAVSARNVTVPRLTVLIWGPLRGVHY